MLVVMRTVPGVPVLVVEVVHVGPVHQGAVAAVNVVDVHVPEVGLVVPARALRNLGRGPVRPFAVVEFAHHATS